MLRYPSRLSSALLCLALLGMLGCPGGDSNEGSGNNASSSTQQKRIIILTNGPDPFWDTCEAGAKAAEKELGLNDEGYIVDFQRGDFTDKKQIDMLKQYALAPDVVAVGISVFNPQSRNLAEEMRALQEKGIKVITIDGDVSLEKYRDARFAYLGTDNYVGGQELGRAAKALSPDGAKFVQFVGNVGAANAIARMDGFVDGAGEGFEELARRDDGGERPKARKNVEDALDQFPECDMLVGIWAYNTPQAVSVVRDRGIREQVKVLCFDAAEASIREMGDGNVDVMVVQNPYQMGYEGVKLLHALVTDDQALIDEMYPDYSQDGTGDLYRTELRVVVPDEESPITADLFEETTEFFKLSEFQEWLRERGLVSS
ncbi:MAG: hypothetical protein DWQ34_08740 [Planctomycetota bacterium]|nr:MAG: hypothetical protein DWQ34_08740 [Planctomycetota bacterium]REK20737.1 MAG: hypothetical protein DWQ41_24135 [Planctomycetota bacterium]REK38080.1 MAG: hypothetical protein DWQ45_05415 [Planctomycetota bacterium]